MDFPFNRYAEFIQEWIYREEWDEIREVQKEAAKIIFKTKNHLLLCTSTASGKTEACLFPALTLLKENPSASVGVLYIGPLKALINDQFYRIENLLQEANILVTKWHGDVPQRQKLNMLKKPSGLLQITPESLEAMLINRSHLLRKIFGDLRFIIIDEVHSFMSGDRGTQVICQLDRLANVIGYHPRRIGLSATIGDPSSAAKWLQANTDIDISVPLIKEEKKKIRLAVEHFMEPTWIQQSIKGEELTLGLDLPSHKYIFDNTLHKKCIIFSNTREATEIVVNGLRQIAGSQGYDPHRYHIHHSCIANLLRESAESVMKESDEKAITAATLTLELGMDIGDVERIVQLLSPHAVSSFVQRLGRSGRRGEKVSEMIFAISEDPITTNTPFDRLIPWYLLQTIAVIQLYLEEKFIEPSVLKNCPMSLLYHQTMSTLASAGELTPKSLVKRILDMVPFKNVSMDEFSNLLRHLIGLNHIQKVENGGLILGLQGEKIVRNFRFFATFRDYAVEYSVKDIESGSEIAHIDQLLQPGERTLLAGYVWEIVEIFPEQKSLLAKRVPEKSLYIWPGRRPDTHTKVLQRMKQILFEDIIYPYLQPGAISRISNAREFTRGISLDHRFIFEIPYRPNSYVIFPWVGSIHYQTLHRIIRFHGKELLELEQLNPCRLDPEPYVIKFKSSIDNSELLEERLIELILSISNPATLVDPTERFVLERYDNYVPQELQQRSFINDNLDLDGLKGIVNKW